MRRLLYLLAGSGFGAILYKSEVISWYRIQEMFRFDSFHLYGIIGSAVVVGAVSLQVIRKMEVKSSTGDPIVVAPKKFHHGTWIGGFLFGIGWALTGSCPGPLYAHIGVGTYVMGVAIVAALAGTWTYSFLRPRLPH